MPARAISVSTPIDPTPARAIQATTAMLASPARVVPILKHLANALDDLEKLRKATGNRIGAMEREHGGAFPHIEEIYRGLVHLEHQAELELVREWRKHPLAPWAKAVPGLGEKLIARLIAETGDPAERPNVAKLWAYCGHGDPARKPRTGMSQEEMFRLGNPKAKTRTYLIASQFVRTVGSDRAARSPYRDIYEALREKYDARDWTDGHKDAAARRELGTVFLRDLWVAARREQGLSITPKRGKRGGVKHRAGHARNGSPTSAARAGYGTDGALTTPARAGEELSR